MNRRLVLFSRAQLTQLPLHKYDAHKTNQGKLCPFLHAGRVDPEAVAEVPLHMVRELLQRRLFDRARLFDHWYVLLVDGSVQEKCRRGFGQDGKSAGDGARHRYVLQAVLLVVIISEALMIGQLIKYCFVKFVGLGLRPEDRQGEQKARGENLSKPDRFWLVCRSMYLRKSDRNKHIHNWLDWFSRDS